MDNTKTASQNKLRGLILAAEFAALLGIFSQFTIPLSVVPLTGQTLALGLFATVATPWIANSAIAVYLLLGAIGIPVFAGGNAGLQVLLGPNGGYLFGFFIYAIIVGYLLKLSTKWWNLAVANLIAAIVQLFVGTVWLAIWNGFTIGAVIKPAMIVFIPSAIIKVVIVVIVAKIIIKRFGIFGAKQKK
ncbi:biotin transporter BioY [Periweissella cryptocerci]|nr:biotin transporter BioY [Periweissella cryptocerci]